MTKEEKYKEAVVWVKILRQFLSQRYLSTGWDARTTNLIAQSLFDTLLEKDDEVNND